MRTRKQMIAALVGTALALGSAQLFADTAQGGAYGPGYPMGPGMMYGYGPGYAMGPGMMYGYDAGPGAMRGYGCGYGAGPALGLSDEQRSKMGKIQQELWGKQRALMDKMYEEYATGANAKDDASARKSYDKIAQLRKQMFDNMLAARKEMDGTLTKEQREQMRGWRY
jgi:Spy/CpxP family protein refolding chaperone